MNTRRQERKVVTVLFCDLVGFTQRAEDQAAQEHPRHPWLQAAAAVAHGGELESAADQLVELHCPRLESDVRGRLAERLVAEGRRGEADEQPQRALSFWRSVGATRYIRQAESLA